MARVHCILGSYPCYLNQGEPPTHTAVRTPTASLWGAFVQVRKRRIFESWYMSLNHHGQPSFDTAGLWADGPSGREGEEGKCGDRDRAGKALA